MEIIISDRVWTSRRASRRCCKNQMLIEIFSESSSPEALIIVRDGEYASLESARCSLNQAIKSMRKSCLYGTSIRKEDGKERLYIVRKI